MARALAELIDAVLPTTCICCGTLGPHICLACRQRFVFSNHRVVRGQLVGVASTALDEPVRQLLGALKDKGRTAALGEVINPLAVALRDGFGQHLVMGIEQVVPRLVAMPTSRRSRRTRGFDLNAMLVRRVARQLGVPVDLGLRFTRQPLDQRRLDETERLANLEGAMRFTPSGAGAPLILIDDVVTTGATLGEAARAIAAAGGNLLGFCVFAETRLRRDSPVTMCEK